MVYTRKWTMRTWKLKLNPMIQGLRKYEYIYGAKYFKHCSCKYGNLQVLRHISEPQVAQVQAGTEVVVFQTSPLRWQLAVLQETGKNLRELPAHFVRLLNQRALE